MRSELSEFSYGFAVTAELREYLRGFVVAAPIFPTLPQEAQLGWDVRIPLMGVSVFLQFKVADALVRPRAAQWTYYSIPYYRISLHRLSKSDQHNRLRALAIREPWVFYAAPRFHRLLEFNQNYIRSAVIHDSAWIPLSSLPSITDNNQHYITYRTGMDVLFFSPEPAPIRETFDGKTWLDRLPQRWEMEKRLINVERIFELRATLLTVLEETRERFLPEFPVGAREGREALWDLLYLCRTFFGAELVFIGQLQG